MNFDVNFIFLCNDRHCSDEATKDWMDNMWAWDKSSSSDNTARVIDSRDSSMSCADPDGFTNDGKGSASRSTAKEWRVFLLFFARLTSAVASFVKNTS